MMAREKTSYEMVMMTQEDRMLEKWKKMTDGSETSEHW